MIRKQFRYAEFSVGADDSEHAVGADASVRPPGMPIFLLFPANPQRSDDPLRRMPPAAYFFLACQKKVCKKEMLGTRIALTRLKSRVVPFLLGIVTPSVVKTPFGRRIEPEYAEISQRGKYLTYESRNMAS